MGKQVYLLDPIAALLLTHRVPAQVPDGSVEAGYFTLQQLKTLLGIDALAGALQYQGVWNATTNTPAIPAAAPSNKGYYYKVSVAGATAIDGVADWQIGDWLVSNGATWDKIDNSEAPVNVGDVIGLDAHVETLIDSNAIWFDTANSFSGDGETEPTAYAIKDGAITNAKIAAAANIETSKIDWTLAVVDNTATKLLAIAADGSIKHRSVGSLPAGGGDAPAQTIDATGKGTVGTPLEIDLSSYATARRITIEMDGLKTSAGAAVRAVISRSDNLSYDGVNGYKSTYYAHDGNFGAPADGDYIQFHNWLSVVHGSILIPLPREAAEKANISTDVWGFDGGGSSNFAKRLFSAVNAAGPVNFIKIFDEYGNAFASGQINVYVK